MLMILLTDSNKLIISKQESQGAKVNRHININRYLHMYIEIMFGFYFHIYKMNNYI